MQSIQRYALTSNYIHLINNDKCKGEIIYIGGRPKSFGNITRFINKKQTKTTNKKPNFIYEGCKENWVVMCAIKNISLREELLVDYHLNQI